MMRLCGARGIRWGAFVGNGVMEDLMRRLSESGRIWWMPSWDMEDLTGRLCGTWRI